MKRRRRELLAPAFDIPGAFGILQEILTDDDLRLWMFWLGGSTTS